MRRRIPLAPAEGWVTLGLVLLICLTMAWALDDARWVLGQAKFLDYLVVAAIGGVLVGFIGPKVGWGRWLTYLIGSIFAALIVPMITTISALPAGETVPSIYNLFQATSDSVVNAYMDIAYRGLPSTIEYLHFVYIFGILVWATSMFASYAVFGHRRPMNAVIVVGVVLVANMSLTENDELWFLVLYSLASLFLLIRSHVFDEQSEWLRRRIGDPSSISSVYLRGGTIFIGAAVAGSVLLTNAAASAPLAGTFNGVQDSLIDITRAVSRFLPTGGQTRAIGLTFGGSTQVQQVWNTNGATALVIHRDPTDKGTYYWRAWTYDQIGLKGWSASTSQTTARPAGSSILDKMPDDVSDVTGRHTFTFTVQPAGFHEQTIFSPGTPTEVTEDSSLRTVGPGFFATLERDDGGTAPYTVTALTQALGEKAGELNQAVLRAAGSDYPQAIKDLYLGVVPGQIGDNAQKLLDRVKAESPSKTPFDWATTMVTILQDTKNFTYVTNVQDLDCAAISTVECFATYKKGFCQYYAPTMAVLMRQMGVPTRMVEGFLPGAVDTHTGIETIPFSSAHAWVEVYFPGYGWVMFDPTGGSLSQVPPLPSGQPVASGPRSTLGLPAASRKIFDEPTDRRGGSVGPISIGRGGPLGPLLAVGFLLLIVVGLLAFVAWQRGPRGATSPEGAYGTVTRIASRFGFGPRPTQTVYEYAGSLGDILPDARPELETVARAKVEAVYAHQLLGEERIAGLKAAQRRLRVSLLKLAFHRKERRRRR
jgi:transglutaminase-like putative cysteine protease